MARSISNWYADHAQGLPDDSTDDEVVETQAFWDLQSSQLSTTRSGRRDARLGGGGARTTRAQSSGGRTRPTSAGGRSAAPPPARGTAGSVPKSVRKKVLAAVQLNPRADVNALAASLTRAGIPVTPQQVAAVLGRSFSRATAPGPGTTTRPVAKTIASAVRRAAHAHGPIGHRRLAALLRAQGITVSATEVAEVMTRRRRVASPPAAPNKSKKPATVIRVTAAAQASRTVHETPLRQSCGMRLSVIGQCRCS